MEARRAELERSMLSNDDTEFAVTTAAVHQPLGTILRATKRPWGGDVCRRHRRACWHAAYRDRYG